MMTKDDSNNDTNDNYVEIDDHQTSNNHTSDCNNGNYASNYNDGNNDNSHDTHNTIADVIIQVIKTQVMNKLLFYEAMSTVRP